MKEGLNKPTRLQSCSTLKLHKITLLVFSSATQTLKQHFHFFTNLMWIWSMETTNAHLKFSYSVLGVTMLLFHFKCWSPKIFSIPSNLAFPQRIHYYKAADIYIYQDNRVYSNILHNSTGSECFLWFKKKDFSLVQTQGSRDHELKILFFSLHLSCFAEFACAKSNMLGWSELTETTVLGCVHVHHHSLEEYRQ